MKKTQRLFAALPFSGGVKKNLVALQDELREKMPSGWRWSESDNLHLTLRFLGEVSDEELVPVCRMPMEAADGISGFEFRLESIGTFPTDDKAPRVLWVGVTDPTGTLRELNSRLEESARDLGFRSEGRGWAPHVTLARAARRETVDTDALAAVTRAWQGREVAKVFAREVVMFNSLRTRDGVIYEELAKAPLAR